MHMSLNMDSAKNKRVHVVALKSSATQSYFFNRISYIFTFLNPISKIKESLLYSSANKI